MNQSISVLNTYIRIHDGLYSLNDLHRAAGGEKRHQPANWLRNDQARELIEEIEQSSDLRNGAVKRVQGGDPQLQGTYACKELVYAYAMWISARFHLAVIRAFDALVSGQAQALPEPPTITRTQAGELSALIAERAEADGCSRAYCWSRFNRHFRIARYRDLPAERFDEAVEYIKAMPGERKRMPGPAAGGRMTVLMTIENDRITGMQPIGEHEVIIDPARLPDNIQAILPGWRLVPVDELDTLTRAALSAAELADGMREYAVELRQWVI